MGDRKGFADLFERATGFRPYPYQMRLALGEELPSLLSVPTGLGKTAAVILGWLWRRRFAAPETRTATPRRLVYCLPTRVLVEQTRDCAVAWLERAGLLAGSIGPEGIYTPCDDEENAPGIRVHLLMGGEVDRDWDVFPERDAILVATQDMLLSRALNRGYAMSRFRWPVQFALLNNDCLWVMDEVQLMGNGLATSAQMQALRRIFGVAGRVASVWMSATMRAEWLDTVDFDRRADAPGALDLEDDDTRHPDIARRVDAIKPLAAAEFEATKDGRSEAELLLKLHEPGTRTLMVANTVRRAQLVYERLRKKKPPARLVLLHSRFRPGDRAAGLRRLLDNPGDGGTIAVCTQVLEAGVDVSARTLVTDLAPWSSLVQRFGRCNRAGEFNEGRRARVVWIPLPDLDDDRKVRCEPYPPGAVREAERRLRDAHDAGPAKLKRVTDRISYGHVVRRKDVVELFDTTADLGGADIDVSRFIRETDGRRLHVFWREVQPAGPEAAEPGPSPAELCVVPVDRIDLAKRHAWQWDHLERRWIRPDTLYPGSTLMLRSEEGGYDPELGWTGGKGATPPASSGGLEAEANDDDRLCSRRHERQTLDAHTEGVVHALDALLQEMPAPPEDQLNALRLAARWHDAGKAHPVFQHALAGEDPPQGNGHPTWAKSGSAMKRYERPGFRHELASALMMLLNDLPDLAAYLAAAHHGKVRLSIRSLPHERHPSEDGSQRFARGIWEGDTIPRADLGGGVTSPETTLTLSYMELGEDPLTGPSWLARMLSLRDDPTIGPFRLAYLEALLRVADWRASAAAAAGEEGPR